MLPPPPPEPFGLWPGQEAAALAFLAVASQWRPECTGLDYAGCRAGLEAEGITVTPDIWRGLRAIEAGAVEGFRERT